MFKDKGINRTQCDVMWPEYLWVHAFHAAFYTLRMEYQARKKIFNKQKLVQRHFFHSVFTQILGLWQFSNLQRILQDVFLTLQQRYSNKTIWLNESYNCNV